MIWLLGLIIGGHYAILNSSLLKFFGLVINFLGGISAFVVGLMFIGFVITYVFPSGVIPKGLEKFNE